ncbi:MAG: hypothetical protein ACOX42_04105 [Clostridia bacterium]|jgi:hypothetical protein
MRILKKLPGYFSITALIISVLISAINRISPLTALYRIVVAVVTFYILGFCISAVLASEGRGTENTMGDTPCENEDPEEFEELQFPVIETAERD